MSRAPRDDPMDSVHPCAGPIPTVYNGDVTSYAQECISFPPHRDPLFAAACCSHLLFQVIGTSALVFGPPSSQRLMPVWWWSRRRRWSRRSIFAAVAFAAAVFRGGGFSWPVAGDGWLRRTGLLLQLSLGRRLMPILLSSPENTQNRT